MTQSRDVDSFLQLVTDDFNWRIKEISDLREVIALSGKTYSVVARKAALALVYAHWEGHVSFVAEAYLKYIAKRKFKFEDLAPAFQAVHRTPQVKEWQNQKDSVSLRLKIVNAVRSLDTERFRGVPRGSISTGGNLNFARFSNICEVMTLNAESIVTDSQFLDEQIVGARNRIAHGASIAVTDDQLKKVTGFVLEIMRAFRTEIENSVVLKRYARAISV